MANIALRIIRPIESAAEKEYLKAFFRFIGCFVTDCAVDEQVAESWDKYLIPENGEHRVDILINFFGEDPYRNVCKKLNIKRIYCYIDFASNAVRIALEPKVDMMIDSRKKDKEEARKFLLTELIRKIWENNKETHEEIQNIAEIYLGTSRKGTQKDELYYFIQAKSCLRVLSMTESLNNPDGKECSLPLVSYIWHTISVLWDVCISLKDERTPYSIYTRVNAAIMIREVVDKLYSSERNEIDKITVDGEPFRLATDSELIADMNRLLKLDRQFVTAYLLLANLYRSLNSSIGKEFFCYSKILATEMCENKEYAFILYRMANFFENRIKNKDKALEAYQMAVQLNSQYYPALFKIGYYAIIDGRYDEAEIWLKKTIQTIFCGRSTKPDRDGVYRNWLTLSLKDSQYVFRAYMLLAKMAIDTYQEQAAKTYIVRACMAAARFSEATLIRSVSDEKSKCFERFERYHLIRSLPVRMMWLKLKPWSEDIVYDYFVRDTVNKYFADLTL